MDKPVFSVERQNILYVCCVQTEQTTNTRPEVEAYCYIYYRYKNNRKRARKKEKDVNYKIQNYNKKEIQL